MARLIKTKFELEGNLFERTSVVEGEQPEVWGPDKAFKFIGNKQPAIDGAERVSGRAKYTSDIQLPGMLYARVLRSSYPHTRIKQVDISRAAALPGVRAIISLTNAVDVFWNGEPLFSKVARFAGDEIAAIAADDDFIAEEAVRLTKVEYEVLPFVTNQDEAILSGAPLIHESGNAGKPKVYLRGNIEKGFNESDVIVESTFHTQCAYHACLETHGAVAAWNGDALTIWESTQSIYRVQKDLAEVFKLPLNKVRVICHYMGGGFGSKQYTGKWSIMAALLAQQAGRPVQLMLNRWEESLAAGYRAPTTQHLKLGARRDGTLTAIDLVATLGVGGYQSRGRAVDGPCQVMYACPNVRTELRAVLTNTGIQRSFRGPGYVEGSFALESLMDELANRLNLDRVQIRMKNYAYEEPRSGQEYSAKNLEKCYLKGAEMIGWPDKDKIPSFDGVKRRGFGMASQVWGGGGGPPAFAWVRINTDGTAEVITGSQDIGTGTRTVFAQIAAEELGIEPDKIVVHSGETEKGPYAPVSWGSMTVSSVGPAVRMAAIDARNQLCEIASDLLGIALSKIQVKNASIYVAGEEKPRGRISEVFREVENFTILGKGSRGTNSAEAAVRTFGAQFAEVEVNTLTGEVEVLQLVTVHDVGRVMNKLGASNQVEGAVIQGIGFSLTEERLIDPASGIVLNPNMEDYLLPTALDFNEIGYDFIDEPDVMANNLGMKGLGEPALMPTAPAIANAITQATGIRFLSLPITRARILEALQNENNPGGT